VTIPVVADADTLFPGAMRGLLIFMDYQGMIKLHWSPLILDEVCRALVRTGRKNSLKEAKQAEVLMCDSLPNATVSTKDVQAQFQAVAPAVKSHKDTHVAACAHFLIASLAYPNTSSIVLITRNTKDFKKSNLAKLGISMQKPDDFLDDLTANQPQNVADAFRHFRQDLSSKPTPEALLAQLEKNGLVNTVGRLRALHQSRLITL